MAKSTQLVTYVNRFGNSSIPKFHHFLKEEFSDIFGGVHLLPFFYPIDGKDAGYDPIDNGVVDQRLGSWEDIKHLSQDFDLMADMIVNHISAQSPQFLDVIAHGSKSEYFDLFLTKDKVFKPNQEEEIKKIFRPKPVPPFTTIETKTGESFEFWTTFSENQIDIDVTSKAGKAYILSTLKTFADNGLKYVRLDAIGFTIKKAGTSCFLLPETYAFMAELRAFANQLGLIVLVEVHAHFLRQIEAAKHVDYFYDFALPPLVLYSLATNNFDKLKEWLIIRPQNCFNVLDTHDGIGVNDVEADWEYEGLINEEEKQFLVKQMHDNTGGNSRKASGTNANNLDIYHVNSTFFDIMGRDNFSYLVARAIQLFLPGISQIYYAGLLAAHNDMDLLQKTNEGRDINRPYYSFLAIKEAKKEEVVQKLLHLIQLRNSHPALAGNFNWNIRNSSILELLWKENDNLFSVHIDLKRRKMQIEFSEDNIIKRLTYGNANVE